MIRFAYLAAAVVVALFFMFAADTTTALIGATLFGMAVTADQMIVGTPGVRGGGPVGAAIVLYEGTMCFIDATDGQLTDTDNAGANKFAGIVVKRVDNSAGADGDLNADYYQEGEFELQGTGFAATDVGKKIYADDNYTITTTSVAMTYVGTVTRFVSSTKLLINIDPQTP